MIERDVLGPYGRVRAFIPSPDQDGVHLCNAHFKAQDIDEEDLARTPILQALINRGAVHAVAYTTISAPDVKQVYLVDEHAPNQQTFMTVLMDVARVQTITATGATVVEDLTLQVMATGHLHDIEDAVRAWCLRVLQTPFEGAVVVINDDDAKS